MIFGAHLCVVWCLLWGVCGGWFSFAFGVVFVCCGICFRRGCRFVHPLGFGAYDDFRRQFVGVRCGLVRKLFQILDIGSKV